jgi:hypothetical protein
VQRAAKAAQDVASNIAALWQTVIDAGAAASQVLVGGDEGLVASHGRSHGEVERFITEVQAASEARRNRPACHGIEWPLDKLRPIGGLEQLVCGAIAADDASAGVGYGAPVLGSSAVAIP